ncbi:MAG TPA: lytic transglycosylase domain-containing protein, partial [Solirubrobacteraceae bacterium]|nr:lytic transglycosylase domain-containing protein [Solirubrobacteraceae bacterium]
AGKTYGIPWNVLAAINKIETDFGRNLSVSSAGAEGWMQFMPAEWKVYGVDATGKGVADPYNPVDAIYAAARYLRDMGGATDLRKAVFAYNHANWYVDQVLHNASIYGSLPSGLVAETGSLAYGRFPLLGSVHYGDDFKHGADPRAAGLLIHGKGSAAAVATQTVTVERILLDPPLAHILKQHGHLASLGAAPAGPSPAAQAFRAQLTAVAGGLDALRRLLALTGHPTTRLDSYLGRVSRAAAAPAAEPSGLPAGYAVTRTPGIGVLVRDAVGNHYRYTGLAALRGEVRPGAQLSGAQVIGTLPPGREATLGFSTVASAGSPIDPRPLVDGYRLQEASNFYHAAAPLGANPFVPDTATSPVGHGYVFPIPANVPWTSARTDMGWDLEAGDAGVGHPLLAIGDAQILHIQDMGAFGPTWMSYKLLSGPAAGRTVFIGHSGAPLVRPGDTVRAGQPIILIHGGSYGGPPGHMEIGWASPDGINTLAAPHYHEGDATAEGASFKSFLLGVTGSKGGLVFPSILGSENPAKTTKAQEYKLSAELNKIANPKVAHQPGPGSVKAPAARKPSRTSASTVSAQPSASGAKLVDVSVPDHARGDEAYAVGTVAGTGRGWAAAQTVILAYAHGTWRLLGAPQDAKGHVVNPALHAIAAVAGGSGFAVGEKGQLVVFNNHTQPRLLPTVTKRSLAAVAARREGRRLAGIAVGAAGTVVHLRVSRARVLKPVAGRPPLSAVAYGSGGALLAGPGGLYRDGADAVKPLPGRFGLPATASASPTSVSERSGRLWVAGGLSEAPGAPADLPFAAVQTATGWQTFCAAGPALGGIVELGPATQSLCQHPLQFSGAARGGLTAVTATAAGAMVAGPAGLAVLRPTGSSGAPVDLHGPVTRLAADVRGHGWALGPEGHLAQLSPGRGASSMVSNSAVVQLPVGGSGRTGTLAVVADGARGLAVAGGQASALGAGQWKPAKGPGVSIRTLALTGPTEGSAITTSGQLLDYRQGRWSLSGGGDHLSQLIAAERSLGDQPLTAATTQPAAGFSALGFLTSSDGYAVGARGLLAHFDGHGWQRQDAPLPANLADVAVAHGGTVAVGAHGTLIEKVGSAWQASAEARSLVADQDFTAVTDAGDGTLLASAGGALIQRTSPTAPWKQSEVPPLGTPVVKLAAYRDAGSHLHAIALVSGLGGLALLDGQSSGWRPLTLPSGLSLSDFQLNHQTRELWIAGQRDGHAVAAEAAPETMASTSSAADEPTRGNTTKWFPL